MSFGTSDDASKIAETIIEYDGLYSSEVVMLAHQFLAAQHRIAALTNPAAAMESAMALQSTYEASRRAWRELHPIVPREACETQ